MGKDRVTYLPLEKVITDGTCAAIRRWVLLEIRQFLAAREGNGSNTGKLRGRISHIHPPTNKWAHVSWASTGKQECITGQAAVGENQEM
jgi:hypothetical protein